MEYFFPSSNYIVPLEELDEVRIPFHIENKTNIIEEIQKDKREFLEGVIEEIYELIEQRENIGKGLVFKIDNEICKFGTFLCELSFWHQFENRHVEKARLDFEKGISELEKEKRMEEVSCFRDIVNLKKDLRYFIQELRKVIQKDKILSCQ